MDYLRIIRPVNALMAAATVLAGFLISFQGIYFEFSGLAMLMLSALFITAYGNVINDIFDIDIDKSNRPDRPLPSGSISTKSASIFCFLLLLAGLVSARFAGVVYFKTASAIAVMLWIYSAYLKSTALWGNMLVALLSAITVVYGAHFAGDPYYAVWPALFAFLLHLAREIVKDMADVEGDQAVGCKTLPIRFGMRSSASIVIGILAMLLGILPIPWRDGLYSRTYLILIVLTVLPPVLYTVLKLLRGFENRDLKIMSGALKFAMVSGIAAVLLGKG
ncbi:MAG: geranylgeranylglycerol-phosphate geranylgeranyltransferase [Fibrobacteres bacterium]|nr:geranylgeranylglycerol-phosphate geranylgeranyltransferase [Fibrobacterota bacterium]